MRKLIPILLFIATARAITLCNFTLNLSTPGGNGRYKNASVVFTLKNYGAVAPTVIGSYSVVPVTQTYHPNNSGLVNGQIIGNDNIVPNNTYYTMTLYNAGTAYYSCNMFITGTTSNLNNISCLSTSPAAVLPDLNFYQNGVFVANQPGLNFIPGTNVSSIGVVNDNTNHKVNVTINATGGGGPSGLTSFIVGNLAPYFTASVGASPTTAPNLQFSANNFAAYSFIANNTASPAVPANVTFDTLFGNCNTSLTYSTFTHMFGCNASAGGLGDPGTNGVVKRTALNTTTTSTYADIIAMFGGCSGIQYLGADGNCHTSAVGTGTVSSVASGTLSPLFTTAVANPTTTASITYTLTNAAAYSIFGNNTGAPGAPSYTSMDSIFGSCTGTGKALIYNTSTHAFGCNTISALVDPGSNGILKRTALNTTAVISYTDIVGLFSTCSGIQYLGADGNCHNSSSGSGTVTSVAAGSLSPLFTTNVTNSTTTPTLAYTLSSAAAYSLLANNTGASASPSYTTFNSIFGSCSASNNALTFNTTTHTFGCNILAGTLATVRTNSINNSSQTDLNLINSTVNAVGLAVTVTNTTAGTDKIEVIGANYTGNSATATAFATAPNLCNPNTQFSYGVDVNGNANCRAIGTNVRGITGNSDTILATDNSGLNEYSFGGAVAVTLPTGITLGSTTFSFQAISATGTTTTFTSTTWTINGNATLVVAAQEACYVYAVAGTTWHAICHAMSQHP